jgi:nucleoside-diphosphate-sugar epimerase
MYAISGRTGQVGGAVARTLLATRQPVRALLRDTRRAAAWAGRGCEAVLIHFNNAEALREAFTGVDGFNQGWIEFAEDKRGLRKGVISSRRFSRRWWNTRHRRRSRSNPRL